MLSLDGQRPLDEARLERLRLLISMAVWFLSGLIFTALKGRPLEFLPVAAAALLSAAMAGLLVGLPVREPLRGALWAVRFGAGPAIMVGGLSLARLASLGECLAFASVFGAGCGSLGAGILLWAERRARRGQPAGDPPAGT